MMSNRTYENILHEAEKLSQEQRLMLVEELIHRLRTAELNVGTGPAWEAYAGSAPYPLCDEDAQEWVSRNRNEGDESLETK